MKEPGKQSDRKVIFAAAVLLALLFAFAGYRALRHSAGLLLGDFFYPYLALSQRSTQGVSEQALLLLSRTELAAKTEALIKENREFAIRVKEAETLADENRELRKLLELPPPSGWNYHAAQVLLRDPMFWRERFTVSINPDSGITPGSAVISAGPDGVPALVGIVSRVGRRNAEVETLFAPSLRLSLQFDNGGTGFLNTGERQPAAGKLPVGHMPVNQKYTPGEEACSTGYEAGIPRGILIGTLSTADEVDPDFSSAQHITGLLTPKTDFDNLRHMVIAVPAVPPGRETEKP
ncbi:hypothetical protein SDC9_145803 [bioreactor metagenome]|uniref:Cell shape-determining protein MreC n=1 Tax=bioreactor metagenome TaxID=1076179 RepID=A0A645EAW9_9ZZZZ